MGVRGIRILAAAIAVALANLASVVAGFWAWRLSGRPDQLAVQVPVTMAVGVAAVVALTALAVRRGWLPGDVTWLAVLLAALPAGAAILVAAHFVVTGYLTGFGNVAALAVLQLAENLVALPLGVRLRQDPHPAGG